MKNKGFTLIELLGVMVLLALIIALTFPSLINSIKNSSNKSDELTLELIYNAVDLYIENNPNDFEQIKGNKYEIKIQDLIDENLLVPSLKLSDSDDVASDKCIQVIYEDEFKYEFKNNGECENKVPLLPKEYQQVEYIEGQQQSLTPQTTGINLRYRWKDISKIELSLQFLNLSLNQFGSMIFRSPSGNSSKPPYICSKTDEIQLNGITGSIVKNYTKAELTNMGFKSIQIIIDENTNEDEIYFGSWSDNYYSKNWQLKYLQLYDKKNQLIRDLIPCYRKSDGEIGMYDIVENKFYTNDGTGTFIKGEDI